MGAWALEPGPTLVLGRMQHAGRVLASLPAPGQPWRVLRRASSGVHVALDGGLLISLAIPSVDALIRDATPRTTLNRNLRVLLAGFREAGIGCHYFGRDWLSYQRRPIALCGLEGSKSGALLLELFVSGRSSLSAPREMLTDTERSTDRFLGKQPISLAEVTERDPSEIAREILAGMVERVGGQAEPIARVEEELDVTVADLSSPIPTDMTTRPPVSVPIGWLDVAHGPAGAWVGGDVLAPTYALGWGGPISYDAVPMEGASIGDVVRARQMIG